MVCASKNQNSKPIIGRSCHLSPPLQHAQRPRLPSRAPRAFVLVPPRLHLVQCHRGNAPACCRQRLIACRRTSRPPSFLVASRPSAMAHRGVGTCDGCAVSLPNAMCQLGDVCAAKVQFSCDVACEAPFEECKCTPARGRGARMTSCTSNAGQHDTGRYLPRLYGGVVLRSRHPEYDAYHCGQTLTNLWRRPDWRKTQLGRQLSVLVRSLTCYFLWRRQRRMIPLV